MTTVVKLPGRRKRSKLSLPEGWHLLHQFGIDDDGSIPAMLRVSPTGYMVNVVSDEEAEDHLIAVRRPDGQQVAAHCPSGGLPGRIFLSFAHVADLFFLPSGDLVIAEVVRDCSITKRQSLASEGPECLIGDVQIFVLKPNASHQLWVLNASFPLTLEPFALLDGQCTLALSVGRGGLASNLQISIFVPPDGSPMSECRVVTYNMLGQPLFDYAVSWAAGELEVYYQSWGIPRTVGHTEGTLSTRMVVTPPLHDGTQRLIITHLTREAEHGGTDRWGDVHCYQLHTGELLWRSPAGLLKGCWTCEVALDWKNKRLCLRSSSLSSTSTEKKWPALRLLDLISGTVLSAELAWFRDRELVTMSFDPTSDRLVAMASDVALWQRVREAPDDMGTLTQARSALYTIAEQGSERKSDIFFCKCVSDDQCLALSAANHFGGGHWVRNGVPFLSAYARALRVPRSTLVAHLRAREKQFHEGSFMEEEELQEIGFQYKKSC
eukprot:6212869-Pleurochrysis_carterae.AAC.1